MNLELTGKRAIVTGASRGIGRSIAQALTSEGCDIAICARTRKDLEAAVESLSANGTTVLGDTVDAADLDAFSRWVESASNRLGGLDIYVSNISAQSFDWKWSFRIDIDACVRGVDAALPYLRQSRCGSIVAIASQAALLSVPTYKPYSAMKAALISYMSSLSRELAPEGIRVNCVSPGEIYIEGGFWSRMQSEDPELYAAALQKNISGRLGSPEEVARAVVFLASPAASFVSGTNLLVDGASRAHVQF